MSNQVWCNVVTVFHRPDVYGVNTTTDLDYWTGNYSVVFLLVHDQEITESWHVSIATPLSNDLIAPPI